MLLHVTDEMPALFVLVHWRCLSGAMSLGVVVAIEKIGSMLLVAGRTGSMSLSHSLLSGRLAGHKLLDKSRNFVSQEVRDSWADIMGVSRVTCSLVMFLMHGMRVPLQLRVLFLLPTVWLVVLRLTAVEYLLFIGV